MSASTWQFVFDQVLGHEGGFTTNTKDRGNWSSGIVGQGKLLGTKFGISAMSHPGVDIKNLTVDQAREIYRKDEWARIKGDMLAPGLDLAMFDFAVNSGASRAVKHLQALVGVKVDGLMGPATLKALEGREPEDLVVALCSSRMEFLHDVDTWPTFGKGWTIRVAQIKKVALQMVENEKKAGDIVQALKPVPELIDTGKVFVSVIRDAATMNVIGLDLEGKRYYPAKEK